MKTRHRIPTIFSIYMVDVLCCALGCVILLWLVNLREAKQRAAAASDANQRLGKTQSALDTSTSELASTRSALAGSQVREKSLQYRLTLLQAEHDDTRRALVLSQKQLSALQIDVKDWQVKARQTESGLASKTAAYEDVLKKLAAAAALTRSLEKDLLAKTDRLQQADLSSKKLAQQLHDLNTLSRLLKEKLTVADIRARLLEDDLGKGKKETADVRKRYQELLLTQDILSRRLSTNARDLDAARTTIDSLKGEKTKLAAQVRLIREAVEHRFAGITLTGQNVLFLVDMSGSMELLDENTPDPDKWPEVCETVAKIMRSLPDLKKFQVLLFSDRVRYPFGKEGEWLPYNPQATPKTTHTGLKAIKPNGETNMAAAFEEAFRYRSEGLDTIYVLSDGLPNAGPGIPPGSFNLSATQRTEYLSKYVRSRLKFSLNRPGPGQPRVRINTIGYFFESPEVGAFLWALAREHEGSFVGMSK